MYLFIENYVDKNVHKWNSKTFIKEEIKTYLTLKKCI